MKIRRQQFCHCKNVEGVHALAHERRKCPQIGVKWPECAGLILRQMRGDVIADLPHLEGGGVLAERREKRGMPRVLRFNRV